MRVCFSFAVVTLLCSSRALAQNSYQCPRDDRLVSTDSGGTEYIIGCGSDTTSTSYTDKRVSTSFNDCFSSCDADSSCTAFTFAGTQNGAGEGVCYYKNSASVKFERYDLTLVGAIKTKYYVETQPAPDAPSTVETFKCPANDGQVVTDLSGVQYVIGCFQDTQGGSFASQSIGDSFNQCFYYCSSGAFGTCYSFTYVGGYGGSGSGNCYFKSGNPGSFTGRSNVFVGAVRYANYNGPAVTFKPTTTTTTTRTTSTSSSSTPITTTTTTTTPTTTTTTTTYTPTTTTTTTTTTRTGANGQPLSTNSPNFDCDSLNGQIVPDQNGILYQIQCSTNYGAYQDSIVTNNCPDWNSCFYLCDNDPNCGGFVWTSYTSTCYNKKKGVGFGSIGTSGGYKAAIQYNGPYLAPRQAQAQQTIYYTTVQYVTQTVVTSYPVTATSISTRFQTYTSSITVTATRITTLPDVTTTLQLTTIIPTTVVTTQIYTTVVSQITTLQLTTVIPTTVVTTRFGTATQITTISNTITTTINPVVTVTPTVLYAQTITVTPSFG